MLYDEIINILVSCKEKIYIAARLSSTSDKEAIDRLTCVLKEKAIVFSRLTNKELCVPILLEEISGLKSDEIKFDTELIIPYDLENILKVAYIDGINQNKKKKKFANVCITITIFIVLSVVLFITCLNPQKPHVANPTLSAQSANPTNIALVGSKEYSDGSIKLTNVHNINENIGFNGNYGIKINGSNAKFTVSSAVAPNGNMYMLAVSNTKTSTKTDTLTLYELRTEGWFALSSYEQKYSVNYGAKMPYKFFIFCDENSRVFSFLYSINNGSFNVYMYDPQTNRNELVGSLNTNISTLLTVACSDSGKAYFAGSNGNSNGSVEFICFDFEEMAFYKSHEQLNSGSISGADIQFYNGKAYFLAKHHNQLKSEMSLYLYCLENYAKDAQKVVYSKELAVSIDSDPLINEYESNVLVDDSGKAYVFYCCRSGSKNSQWYTLDIIDVDGKKITSNEYESFYQPLFKFSPRNGGIFWGEDKSIYFLEYYDSLSTDLVIGKISGENYKTVEEKAKFTQLNMYQPLPIYKTYDLTSGDSVFVDILFRQNDGILDQNVVIHGYARLSIS